MTRPRCNLCGSDRVSLYLDSEKMLRCDQCQVVFLAPAQIPTNLESYYQNNPFYAENVTDPGLVRLMTETAHFYLKNITKHSPNFKGKTLVDVGSNYGALVEEANRVGFQAIGLEKNKFLVTAGKERGLNILATDLSDLPQSVNIITAMHVLEHLVDPRVFIQDAYRKLVPGGILAIGVPNIKSYLAQKDGLSWRYVALEHLFYFSEEVLTRLLRQEGFEIVEMRQDSSNLNNLSIRKLLHYLVGGPVVRDRFQVKSWEGRATSYWRQSNRLRGLIRTVLIFAIRILRREDFILIITKKII